MDHGMCYRNCDSRMVLIKILGFKNCKKVALNRDEWAKFLKKARAHQGFRANDDDDDDDHDDDDDDE